MPKHSPSESDERRFRPLKLAYPALNLEKEHKQAKVRKKPQYLSDHEACDDVLAEVLQSIILGKYSQQEQAFTDQQWAAHTFKHFSSRKKDFVRTQRRHLRIQPDIARRAALRQSSPNIALNELIGTILRQWLTDQGAEALAMNGLGNLPICEIATILGMPAHRVRYRKDQALKQLRAEGKSLLKFAMEFCERNQIPWNATQELLDFIDTIVRPIRLTRKPRLDLPRSRIFESFLCAQ